MPSHIPLNLQPSGAHAGMLPEIPEIPLVPPVIIMRRQTPQVSNNVAVVTQPRIDLSVHSTSKRKADQLLIIQESGDGEAQWKCAPKKCWKCEETGCLGATGKQKCTSACKSYGTYECTGKESRNPKKLCPTLLQRQQE